ncbi:MAG: AMP-dependent synthetase [Acidobacteria bacterium RIFCSPLOWO2_02_FULL_68_18]|nr:MAG: AMP-dependent synthetase [Acidobacteria bacterium RIFCSPLOWO2_02_FULL_68_18]
MVNVFRDETLAALLAHGSDRAPAIGAPGRASLTYDQLRALVASSAQWLHARGMGRNDRVAIVLANGPHAATAFLAVAAGATAAPLNAHYRAEEFEFYLTDLEAKALLIEAGMASPAREVASRLGLRVFELRVDPAAPAGMFELGSDPQEIESGRNRGLTPDDVALVLHTSGTTSRPKLVPLTQRNLSASAQNIRDTLALTPDDVCLNIMPLFHIHGLIGGVLSSLAAGAHVSCTPGSHPVKFFAWLDEVQPTWYTAAPSLHRAIVVRAARHAESVARSRLRFIRSSSAALRPELMATLEQTFRVPVLQSYGMTEASHQVASNPLPPAARKPGSVGRPAGPEVAVMDEAGSLLPPGSMGEVVIRGANVTAGYEANPDANAAAFVNGWFRTGDQGRIDEDGYLWLTGRLKELINRGGEKVSPLEIEAVLMEHPGVQQVVVFAVPDESHGEEIAAAVVPRGNAGLTDRDLRHFVASHLADFKVPRRIFFVDQIPGGATGKLQRIGMAEKLGLVPAAQS